MNHNDIQENHMRILYTVIILILLEWLGENVSLSQTVTTFVSGSGISGPNGFAVDRLGNLYVANEGLGNGTTVSIVSPNGSVDTFAVGFNGPDGLAFDSTGNLYVSNFNTGVVNKVDSNGTVQVFATGFNRPAGLAFDSAGVLYVANYG